MAVRSSGENGERRRGRATARAARGRGGAAAAVCAQAGSPELRDELVRRFMPLARSLAMRYRRRSESLDDLVQVANLGLVKAIDGFDPGRGRPFTAYAVPTILGELRRHFRDHVWNVRLPRGLQEMTMQVDEAINALTEELGQFPTAAQIGERLEISTEDVLEALEAGHARRTISLDAPRGERTRSRRRRSRRSAAPSAATSASRRSCRRGAGLDEREWQVLRMRFVDELTQQEIGRRLGVSQMQISRISRRALWKLLAAVRARSDDTPALRQPPSARRERAGLRRRAPLPSAATASSRRVEEADGLVDAGQLEQPANVRVGAADREAAALLREPALGLDQQAEPGRVDELAVAEIDEDRDARGARGSRRGPIAARAPCPGRAHRRR